MPSPASPAREGTEIEEEEPPEELADKLEYFFGSDEEVAPFEGEGPPSPAEEAVAEEPEVAEEPGVTFEAEEEVVPALAGSPEDSGFGYEEELEAPPEGLEDKLEDMFGEETTETEDAAPAVDMATEDETSAEGLEAMFEEEPEEEQGIAPALSGDESEGTEIVEEEFLERLQCLILAALVLRVAVKIAII